MFPAYLWPENRKGWPGKGAGNWEAFLVPGFQVLTSERGEETGLWYESLIVAKPGARPPAIAWEVPGLWAGIYSVKIGNLEAVCLPFSFQTLIGRRVRPMPVQ